MSTRTPISTSRIIPSAGRGKRIRPIPTQQLTTRPTAEKPLQNPVAKCANERVRVKPVPAVSTKLTYEQRKQLAELSRQREAELPLVEIEEAIFTIYSTEEIVGKRDETGQVIHPGLAVVEVTNTEMSGPGSINDPQMGPTDNTTLCATCSRDNSECPGHNGFIRLPKPFPHPLFLREIIMALNVVCNDCGHLLLSRDEIKERGILRSTGPARLSKLEKASVGLTCRHEKGPEDKQCLKNPTYLPTKTKDTNQITYKYIIKGKEEENFRSGQEILDIFNNVSQEDAELMGFTNGSHPKRMIMEVLLVIPPPARPPITEDGNDLPDGLTQMYVDIIRQVKILRDAMSDKPAVRQKGERKRTTVVTIQELEGNLYNRIKHFINNTDGWYAAGGQPFLSLTEILTGKEGMIRQNLMAKRVNFSSRTVISPDPTLAFGQISVPIMFAPILTPEVRVNRYNRAEMQNLFEKGRVTYIRPIVNVASSEGKQIQFSGSKSQVTQKLRENYTLKDGDIIYRWMQDGDIVIFNRQPTLHLYSFMGYYAVLRDQKTFGLHMSYTTPLNADFDGDEGNMHILQVLDSRAEAEELMSVRNCLINAQSNKPTMGIVFDGPVVGYLITQPDATVHPGDFHDALALMTQREQLASLEERMRKYNIPYTAVVRNDDGSTEVQYTGRALFSALLPEDFYYEGSGGVLIQEGVLTNGVITRSHIGPERDSIIQVMALNYPVGRTVSFITDGTWVLNRIGQELGYSIGISSCMIDDPELEKIKIRQIEEARMLVASMGERPGNPIESQKYEEQILAYIGAPSDVIERELKERLPKDNALNIAVLSGAKGKMVNIRQIAFFAGQQHIGGGRPKPQLTYEQRCLPYFNVGDPSLEAHGMCTSSFLKGLGPAEMYFHQMAAREGLMGTAVSTSDTGFMHRKAIKALQDVKTAYDGSVRNFDKSVFQYVYGEDGFDPARLMLVETKKGKFLSFFDAKQLSGQINSRYGF